MTSTRSKRPVTPSPADNSSTSRAKTTPLGTGSTKRNAVDLTGSNRADKRPRVDDQAGKEDTNDVIEDSIVSSHGMAGGNSRADVQDPTQAKLQEPTQTTYHPPTPASCMAEIMRFKRKVTETDELKRKEIDELRHRVGDLEQRVDDLEKEKQRYQQPNKVPNHEEDDQDEQFEWLPQKNKSPKQQTVSQEETFSPAFNPHSPVVVQQSPSINQQALTANLQSPTVSEQSSTVNKQSSGQQQLRLRHIAKVLAGGHVLAGAPEGAHAGAEVDWSSTVDQQAPAVNNQSPIVIEQSPHIDQQSSPVERKPSEQELVQQQYLDQMDDLDIYNVQGPDESAVLDAFNILRYSITNLADLELNGAPFKIPIKKEQKDLFATLVRAESGFKHYIADADSGLKSAFFTAVIWAKVIDALLAHQLPVYGMQDLEKAVYAQIYVHGKSSVDKAARKEKYHTWRSYTAHLLDQSFEDRSPWGVDGEERAGFVLELMDLLSRYSNTNGGSRCKALVELVVDKAVVFAKLMAKARPYWECRMPRDPRTKKSHGFLFDKQRMEAHTRLDGGRQGFVDLAVSPFLLKDGERVNGEERYNRVITKVKTTVVVCGGSAMKEDPDSDYKE